MPTPLSAPFRLAACALLSLALLVFATPTRRLLAGNVSLASTLDEVDNALRTDNAFIHYGMCAALLVCALTFFLWSARGGSGEQQASGAAGSERRRSTTRSGMGRRGACAAHRALGTAGS